MMRWSLRALGLLLPLALFPTPARADLHCPTPDVRSGEIKSGAPLTQRYHIVNNGPGIVNVTGLHTSCGCVVPHLEQRRLPVGETAEVALVVNTLAQGAGDRAWTLTISYETEGQNRQLLLTLRARVITEIRVEPTSLHVDTDTVIKQIVQVSDLRAKPLHITAVHGSAPWLRARPGETTHDGNVTIQSVQVEIGADCPVGQQAGTVQMITDDPLYPELLVPVTVSKRKRGAVHAAPEQVDLRGSSPGPLPPRLVRLVGVDDQPVLVERIEVDHPALACRWAAGPGPNATLRVEVDGTKVGAAGLHTVVRVHLAGATGETLEIPVVCSPR